METSKYRANMPDYGVSVTSQQYFNFQAKFSFINLRYRKFRCNFFKMVWNPK